MQNHWIILITTILWGCSSVTQTVPEQARCKALLDCIDVGQGNACLWRSNGHTMLLDAGPDSMGILDSLHARGIDSLDWIFLSHGHRDHVGGAWELLGHMKIGRIHVGLDTTHPWGTDSVRTLAKRFGVPVDTLVRGDTLCGLAPWHARIIWPPSSRATGDNGASLVVHISDAVQSFLYTGDIGLAQESEILELEPDLRATILQVPHHGSATSSELAFIGQLSPTWAFILVGLHNEYGHPAHILRTDLNGTLQATFTYNFGVNVGNF